MGGRVPRPPSRPGRKSSTRRLRRAIWTCELDNDVAMPELPDVTVYVEALQQRIAGQMLDRVRLASPFVLRTVEPRPSEVEGRKVIGVTRMGKRIVLELETSLFIVIHLMIAGRFKWLPADAKIP